MNRHGKEPFTILVPVPIKPRLTQWSQKESDTATATHVLLEVPSGYFSDRVGRRVTLLVSATATALGFACYALGSGFAIFAGQHVFKCDENITTALTDGIAFSDRAGGNLARPFYTDGIDGNPHGPFSRTFADWSPFSTGLQLDLVVGNLLDHLAFVTGPAADTAPPCTDLPPDMAGSNRLANGIQIFPGSVPIYRNGTLIGGIGVSGDGIDQDDMISFLGLHNAGVALGTGVGNAPPGIRADTLAPQGTLLRYVNCPFSPFLDTNEQNVCAGK